MENIPLEYVDVESITDLKVKFSVKKFLSYKRILALLDESLKYLEELKKEKNDLIKKSLWRSIIVNYYLAFDSSSKGLSHVLQPSQVKKILNENLFIKHSEYLSIRKQLVAHIDNTDLDVSKFALMIDPKNPTNLLAILNLNIELAFQDFKDFRDIETIIKLILTFLKKEIENIQDPILSWFQSAIVLREAYLKKEAA